jgi:anti-sigma regulatory factor (Ser/Thr protein kinase)/ActR/RegA family two-component response regulator
MGHILIVGGDRQHVDALRNANQLQGHDFAICEDALAAIRHARNHPVDVVITDPTTGVDHDLALVEELKSLRPDVRTIVLAPAISNAEVLNTLKAHVFACFSEPLRMAEIAEMTRAALEASEWRDGIEIVSGLPNWLTLIVSCRMLTADRLTQFMTEWRADVPSDERDLLMTAFREMLINAMEHGAGFDQEKVIKVTAARTARAIVFHFLDPGDGFDHTDLQHAAESSDPDHVLATTDHRAATGLRPGGFGMLIVRQVVDELVYNEKGNEVLMIKHVDKNNSRPR